MKNPRGLFFKRLGKGSHSRILHLTRAVSKVGRHETCHIRIAGQSRTVSREHCQLTLENGRVYIENISKSTSTFLNQDKVRLGS